MFNCQKSLNKWEAMKMCSKAIGSCSACSNVYCVALTDSKTIRMLGSTQTGIHTHIHLFTWRTIEKGQIKYIYISISKELVLEQNITKRNEKEQTNKIYCRPFGSVRCEFILCLHWFFNTIFWIFIIVIAKTVWFTLLQKWIWRKCQLQL